MPPEYLWGGAGDGEGDAFNYRRMLNDQSYECSFRQSLHQWCNVTDYPLIKFFKNRVANILRKAFFVVPLNDTTNAFKAYCRSVIEGCRPLLSAHFNLAVEIPLKAIVRGYTWAITPISWQNRKQGIAKLKIRGMGGRYFYLLQYLARKIVPSRRLPPQRLRAFSAFDYQKGDIQLPAIEYSNFDCSPPSLRKNARCRLTRFTLQRLLVVSSSHKKTANPDHPSGMKPPPPQRRRRFSLPPGCVPALPMAEKRLFGGKHAPFLPRYDLSPRWLRLRRTRLSRTAGAQKHTLPQSTARRS